MKIYLAGSCGSESRTMMVGIAKLLRGQGYEVYRPFESKIEENASLMTYCGSSLFVSCKTETLFSEILYTLNKEPTFKENARVILT